MTKILVIEDEAESRDIFIDSLEAEGFEVIAAENGFVGIQQAQAQLPDLVLCDILMPEIDGYGVLTTLRQNSDTAMIPFIFLSAKTTKTEIRQGMNLGADDYLTKPSTIEELLEAIATRLEKQAAIRQCYIAQSQQISNPQSTDTNTSADSQSPLPTCPQLKEVFDFIEANYYQSITLCHVAQAVGYSAAYLTDLVRRQTGKPVNYWIVERRMAAVRALLLETNQSANQIAEAVGYQNEGHFFRQFRQYHGTTPKAWRKAQQIQ